MLFAFAGNRSPAEKAPLSEPVDAAQCRRGVAAWQSRARIPAVSLAETTTSAASSARSHKAVWNHAPNREFNVAVRSSRSRPNYANPFASARAEIMGQRHDQPARNQLSLRT